MEPDLFHPLIGRWFEDKYGEPTDVQRKAWPLIASGGHVLMSAPTGSGKTLAAFLWALDRLVSGAMGAGATRVLYVSPLKALNTDIRENLLIPLAEIRRLFLDAGVGCPDVRVLTRSGDTPPSERARMKRRPPEILITTPESLNLILSTKGAAAMLGGVRTVILDEIHAVISIKRGTHLVTAVERAARLAGEFQRIALSATIGPLERVAGFVGGYEARTVNGETSYSRREVAVVRSGAAKTYDLRVSSPAGARTGGGEATETGTNGAGGPEGVPEDPPSVWAPVVAEIKARVSSNRSTLVFTGARRLAEKLALMINEGEDEELAYAHHGSLSREIRAAVERRMREGRLRAVVATSSLELGIDVGTLDEVILVGTPPSVASAVQRIGRAGHKVGVASRGLIVPAFERDRLDAAVMARCVLDGDIEEARIVSCPLDVLAQVIVSMVGVEEWDIDALRGFFRRCEPFHDLTARQFDLVLEMLAGRYESSRVRELRPRVSVDRVGKVVKGKEGVLTLLYHSGGTIPDRGYYTLRREGSLEKIGELDEEFVWERKTGDAFSLGSQSWRITRIDSQNVEVVPWRGRTNLVPFWRAEQEGREFHFSERIGEFLERWGDRLEDEAFPKALMGSHRLEENAARDLADLLARQRSALGGRLPHRHRVVIERVEGSRGGQEAERAIVHTMWGGRVNRPFAHALASAWEARCGYPLETYSGDDSILLLLPHDVRPRDLIGLVTAGNIEPLLRGRFESSGLFGARFRENAARALLLPKGGFKKRMPLWLNRLRSKKLLDAVSGFGDFPIILETWRECLRDEFDLDSLRLLLDELASGEIAVSEARTSAPSPFARGLVWRQTNVHMYQGDEPASGRRSGVRDELFRETFLSEVARSPHLRPGIGRGEAARLEEKLRRTAPGYAPGTPIDLLSLVSERILVPEKEWRALLEAVERDHGTGEGAMLGPLAGKLLQVELPGASGSAVAALEVLPRIAAGLGLEVSGLLPRALPFPAGPFGMAGEGALPGPAGSDEAVGGAPEAGGEMIDAGGEPAAAFSDLLGEWLAFYGPLRLSAIRGVFGVSGERLEGAVEDLVEEGSAVTGRLTEGAADLEACDSRNLEYLLRMKRKASRASFTPLEPETLPLFLAHWQGLARKRVSADSLKDVLDTLFGYPLPAELWEEEILPARLEGYSPSWLDLLFHGGDLMWFGCGTGRASFCFREEYDLFAGKAGPPGAGPSGAGPPGVGLPEDRPPRARGGGRPLLPHAEGKFTFGEILEFTGLAPDELHAALWESAWGGEISSDAWESVRRGLASGFKFPPGGAGADVLLRVRARSAAKRRGAGGGAGRRVSRWRVAAPMAGGWYRAQAGEGELDPIDREERVKDRVRQLFERYGVLFRELLERELPGLRWANVFRTLRVMELSGEAVGGQFFRGIRGLQFVSPRAEGALRRGFDASGTFWVNACDPASLCGVKVRLPGAPLPARLPSNHLVFRGARLALVSRRSGRELDFRIPPEDPGVPDSLSVFSSRLERSWNPAGRVLVETINGVRAEKSPYAAVLVALGFRKSYRGLVLERGF